MLDRHALLADTAAGRGGSDGFTSGKDLEALARDGGVPTELRTAARYLLDHDPRACGLGELADLAEAAASDPERAGVTQDRLMLNINDVDARVDLRRRRLLLRFTSQPIRGPAKKWLGQSEQRNQRPAWCVLSDIPALHG
ncbi:MAG: hypothetical protein JXR83_13120 [Deltaproteobacteria bacterium]|nr:hypothetical protein [Deltaproteobacteria bacterium]